MSKKRQNYMKQADRFFSQWVRSRGYCQAEGEHNGHLQCAHLISRSYKVTRTDPENAVAMCARHHIFFTHRPIEWEDWVESRWPGLFDELKRQARTHAKVDWRQQADYWKSVVAGAETPTTRLV